MKVSESLLDQIMKRIAIETPRNRPSDEQIMRTIRLNIKDVLEGYNESDS